MDDPYVGGIRRKVGWFVMFGLGAIMILLLVETLRTEVFARKFTLYVEPTSASSFYVGQEVKFQGFTIGRVDDIELQKTGKVRVALRLLERYRGMLHQGSQARLFKPGLFGQESLELTSGDVRAAVLKGGEQLPCLEQANLEQLLTDMKPAVANADILLGQLVQLARWLNDPNSDIRLATANIRAVTQGMDQKSVQQAVKRVTDAAAQLERLSSQLADNETGKYLAQSLRQTALVMKNIEPLTDELRRQAPETLAQSRALMARLDELTRSMQGIASDMQQLTPELPGLVQESRKAMQEMYRLSNTVRTSWLGGGESEPMPSDNGLVAPPAIAITP
jgi:phospholipid/cholesterol/gamma-HCH transport system substrate-binding protein